MRKQASGTSLQKKKNRQIVSEQNHNLVDTMNLTEKYNATVTETGDKELTKVEAEEALPIGPFAGLKPGSEPVDGRPEDLGVIDPAPSDWGEGAGA